MRPRIEILIIIGAFLLVGWIYHPALLTLPVADDFRIVGRTNFNDAARAFRETVGYGRNEYRPLVAFSFALSNQLWGGDPRGYHLESIFLHALVVVLLLVWIRQITGSAAIAGMSAVLFAVHPIHHARVVWIAARDSLPSTVCLLLALILYTRTRLGTQASVHKSWRLICVSLVMFILSLLYYEGSVILPGIIAGMELFLFPQTEPPRFLGRLRGAAIRTIPFAVVAVAYVAWWLILFRGDVGGYDLQFSIVGAGQNCYRILYHLFHGSASIAGVLYFLIILMGLVLPRERRALVWFSVLFMTLAYLPFVAISGFASRFGYVSAIGYVLLVATILASTILTRNASMITAPRRWLPALAAVIFVALACYYASSLRAEIADWKMAGEIAAKIPREVKARYPNLPEGSILVLARVPRMHGHAYIYPLGLRAALERLYPGNNLKVYYGSGEVDEIINGKDLSGPKPIYFRYLPNRQTIIEIGSRQM